MIDDSMNFAPAIQERLERTIYEECAKRISANGIGMQPDYAMSSFHGHGVGLVENDAICIEDNYAIAQFLYNNNEKVSFGSEGNSTLAITGVSTLVTNTINEICARVGINSSLLNIQQIISTMFCFIAFSASQISMANTFQRYN